MGNGDSVRAREALYSRNGEGSPVTVVGVSWGAREIRLGREGKGHVKRTKPLV